MNYQESTVSGQSWKRCNRVVIGNDYQQTPQIDFQTEIITVLAEGKQFREGSGGKHTAFDPAAIIPLRDPETGALTGATTTQGELYVALWSLWMQLEEGE